LRFLVFAEGKNPYTRTPVKKHSLPAVVCALALVACGKGATVAFDMQVNGVGPKKADELLVTAMRTTERRAKALEEKMAIENLLEDIDVRRHGGDARMIVRLSTKDAEALFTERVTEDFTLEFMETAPVEEADIIVGETQGFRRINLHKEDIEKLTETSGGALIHFTDTGAQKKNALFAERMGEEIGIFIRGMPVYKLRVEDQDVQDETLLIKIPQPNVIPVFVDDVNVGLHVSFSPIK
jgi:hypothetical protein